MPEFSILDYCNKEEHVCIEQISIFSRYLQYILLLTCQAVDKRKKQKTDHQFPGEIIEV